MSNKTQKQNYLNTDTKNMQNHIKDVPLQSLHILGAMYKFVNQAEVRFHMPGHKGKLSILKDSFLDCTELSYTDCLECPTDSILQAEKDISAIFHTAKSFILTDGATCGILTTFYVIQKLYGRGAKVAIARNSHKSVYNACNLLGIEPILLDFHMQKAMVQQPTLESIQKMLTEHTDIKAIFLTSPDYYGNVIDLQAVQSFCRHKNILLCVDNAHGSFLHFDTEYSKSYAGRYADIWVDSTHKTLPCLTQGALLHINNSQLAAFVLEGLHIFRTTSPSYLIMASIEYGVKYMHTFGGVQIATVRESLQWAREQLSKLGLKCYTESATLALSVDFLQAGFSTDKVQVFLEEQGIFTELNDGRYLLFYCSVLTERKDLEKLVQTIGQAIQLGQVQERQDVQKLDASAIEITQEQVLSYVEAMQMTAEYLPIERAVGYIVARNIGITPPCFPLVIAGERLSKHVAEKLKTAKHTFGLEDGKIPVLAE